MEQTNTIKYGNLTIRKTERKGNPRFIIDDMAKRRVILTFKKTVCHIYSSIDLPYEFKGLTTQKEVKTCPKVYQAKGDQQDIFKTACVALANLPVLE